MTVITSLTEEMHAIKREMEDRQNQLRSRAQTRLAEIESARAVLDAEENEIRSFLNMPGAVAKGVKRRGPRTPGTRIPASAKAAVLADFIRDGHIRNGGKLTPELRSALRDAGFKPYDFPKIGTFLPAGWSATSNGQRGLLAETIFHQR